MADFNDDVCLETYRYLFQKDILKDKVAFISGGGSGIGFRIAEILMRHGCRTVIASRRLAKLQEVSASFKLLVIVGRTGPAFSLLCIVL